MFLKESKKKLYSWAFYDWANSGYSTTVVAGFFPIFFKTFWSAGGNSVETTARLGTVLSVSSLIVAILSPLLGVMSDLNGLKKRFCFFFMLLGAFSCLWMAFIHQGQWQTAAFAYALGVVGFGGSTVFYDSLLPSVAQGKDMDFASSLGYSFGYLGGGLLFSLNVLFYLKPHWFSLSGGIQAVQLSFITVAFWWILFSLPLLFFVNENIESKEQKSEKSLMLLLSKSLNELKTTFLKILNNKNLTYFLMAYWLYIDGVYTVITMAVDYGMSLGLSSSHLIGALLLTQFIGFPFALLYGKLSQIYSAKKLILTCIFVYGLTVLLSTQMSEAWHFYLLAAVIGMVQGGVQSLSRSLFARMIPPFQSGEYFGLFNLIGKFASIIGPFVVALGVMLTKSSQWGMSGLFILFIVGGGLLYLVNEDIIEK